MSDTTDIDQPTEPEPTDFERLMAVDLATIDPTQKLGVALCVDPDDYDDGGVHSELNRLAEYVTIYAGAGKNAEALAICHVDQVGRPGSLVRLRAGAKVEDLDPGACSWNGSEIVVALKVRQIELKADRSARKAAAKYARRQAEAIRRGDPQVVLDAWATITGQEPTA